MKKQLFLLIALLFMATGAWTQNVYFQGFEDPNWVPWQTGDPLPRDWQNYTGGNITRVASGYNGIASASGSDGHAVIEVLTPTGGYAPYTFGGQTNEFGSAFTRSLDVYIDPAWADGKGFDLSMGISNDQGDHKRDFIWHVGKVGVSGLLVNASNNSDWQFNSFKLLNENSGNYYTLTTAGWYTLESVFYAYNGLLYVDFNLKDAGDMLLHTITRGGNPDDDIPGSVGGARYMWFTYNNVEDLAIDNTFRIQYILPVHNISQNTFYGTIQAAINEAFAGNEIQVSEGIYPEQVIIGADLDGLQLIGAVDVDGNPTSIITPGVLGEGNGIRAIGSDNLVIQNFEITGALGTGGETRGWGVLVGNSSSGSITNGVMIDNIYSHNNAADGIRVRRTINATVQNCKSINNSDGITFYAYGTIHNNIVGNSSMRGIYVNGQSVGDNAVGTVTITKNTVYENLNGGAIGCSDARVGGIIVYSAAANPAVLSVIIEENEVHENVGPGILLYKVNNFGPSSEPGQPVSPDNISLVKNNTVYDNIDRTGCNGPGDGILIYMSHFVEVEGNLIYGNENAGVRVTNNYRYHQYGPTLNTTLTGNTIYDNDYGILVQGGSVRKVENTVVQNNKIYDNNTGLENLDNFDEVVDAICNWWGTAIGSEIDELIEGNVDYSTVLLSDVIDPSDPNYTCGGPLPTPGPVTTISDITIECIPGTISVPVTVTDFNNVGAISLVLNYDHTILGVTDVVLNSAIQSGGGYQVLPNGILTISYFSDLGVSLADGSILFTINFDYIGSATCPDNIVSAITFDYSVPGYCEYAPPGLDSQPYSTDPPANYFIAGSVSIVRTTPPAEVGGPVAIASTVECASEAVAPTTLPVVKDVCGVTLSPTAGSPIKHSVNHIDFSSAVTTGPTQAPETWYTDRYAPAGFESQVVFAGDNRLKHSIHADDGANNRPSGLQGGFYNTQGRKYDLGVGTDYMEIKLYIPSDWATTNKRMAGFWGTAFNASDVISGYPIVEFASDNSDPRFQVWEGNAGWVSIGLPTGFSYDTWYLLKIKILPSGQFLYSAGDLNYTTVSYGNSGSVRMGNVILQGYNYDPVDPLNGVTYDIYWDDFMWNDTYSAPACEGIISYTYDYIDCAGHAFSWIYTYTIVRNTAPAEVGGPVTTVGGPVECESAATAPAQLPVIHDVCGTLLTPSWDSPVINPTTTISRIDDFASGITLNATAAPGKWYVDRYAPAGFETAVFDGDFRLKHTIDETGPTSGFYSTQGRKYNVGQNTVEIKLYVPAAWETTGRRMAGFWGTAVNTNYAVSAYPILEFTSDGNNPRFRAWENGVWHDLGLPNGFVYDSWVTLKMELLSSGEFEMFAGDLTFNTTELSIYGSAKLNNVILQGHNYGDAYSIYWDDFDAVMCEGTIDFVYRYFDCAGLQFNWLYSYDVDHITPPAVPADGGSTVYDIADAVAPTLPVVTDVCGVTLNAVLVSVVDDPDPFTYPGTRTYSYTYTDCAGLVSTWKYVYTIPGVQVSGIVSYYNNANTPMNNVDVDLMQGVNIIKSATTDGSGLYSFNNVVPGTYDVVFSTVKPVGGVNSSDAAQVNFWSVNPSAIEKVRFYAGDVNNNNSISAGDAGMIQAYFLSMGANAFLRSPWTFWIAGETISANPGTGGDPALVVPAGGPMVNQDFYALVTGDFNRSFTPGNMKSVSESLNMVYGEVIEIAPNTAFELPVNAAIEMEVGAVSLIINVPADKLEVQGVYLTNDPATPVNYSITGDELRISWYSLTPINLNDGDALLTLQMFATDLSGNDNIYLSLAADPLNELADGSYNVNENALISVDIIKATALGIDNPDLAGKLRFANYPNPFKGNTNFAFTVPTDGKVTLEVYNITGTSVMVMLDQVMPAGDHLVRMDAGALKPGVYMATLTLKENETMLRKTIKVIAY